MQASGQGRDGAMAALIGLDDARLPELVAGASEHGVFVVANRNAPGQVVVSGERPAIEAGAELAKSLGAKRAIVLPVSVAAHSPLMAEAADGMRAALAGVAFHDPVVPLLANADARPIETAEACRAELVEHLTAGVDWIRIVERMAVGGRHDLRRDRSRPRPDRSHQTHRPGRGGHPGGRPRHRSTGSCRWAPCPPEPPPRPRPS